LGVAGISVEYTTSCWTSLDCVTGLWSKVERALGTLEPRSVADLLDALPSFSPK